MADDYGGPSRPLIIAKKNWTIERAAQRQDPGTKSNRNGLERQAGGGDEHLPALYLASADRIKYSGEDSPFVFGVNSPSQFPIRSRFESDDYASQSAYRAVINNSDNKVYCDKDGYIRPICTKSESKKTKSKLKKEKQSDRSKIKCLLLGDGAVGKTSMITSYAKKSFEHDYKPTTFDNYNVNVYVDQEPIKLEFWDTAGQDNLEGIRKKVCYPEADVVLLCFSVVRPNSFRSIENRWIPRASEIKAPIILVGTQCDLRDDAEMSNDMMRRGEYYVSEEQARALAIKLNVPYIETSAVTRKGIKDAFDSAILAALPKFKQKKSLWKQLFCFL